MPQTRDDILRRLGRDPSDPQAAPLNLPQPSAAATNLYSPPQIPWQWNYAKPGPSGSFFTQLNPQQEAQFQQWLKANPNAPKFDPSPTADYDYRGFWKALQAGDPRAVQSVNPIDKRIHLPDVWKTPYHRSFSADSMYATPNAPRWINNQLVDQATGQVLFDESIMPELQPKTSVQMPPTPAPTFVRPTNRPPRFEAAPSWQTRYQQLQQRRAQPSPPGMQGAIPAGAAIRPKTRIEQAMDDLQALRDRVGQLTAPLFTGMTAEQAQDLADAGLLIQQFMMHGSPHELEGKPFTTEMIGEGEGGAAYGWGMPYSAENYEVGKRYWELLSEFHPNGVPLENPTGSEKLVQKAMNAARSYGLTDAEAYDRTISQYENMARATERAARDPRMSNFYWEAFGDKDWKELADVARRWRDQGVRFERTGGVYGFNIRDEHIARMLDWDKPLSQQPEVVKDFVNKTFHDTSGIHSGGDLYERLALDETRKIMESNPGVHERAASIMGQKAASQRLAANGIPGLRYLDQGSRGAGFGTSNMVTFDPAASIEDLPKKLPFPYTPPPK